MEAYQQLKELVAQDALLHCPEYRAAKDWQTSGRPFEVQLDSSETHVGSTLLQLDGERLKYRPIAYFSESLNSTQLNVAGRYGRSCCML